MERLKVPCRRYMRDGTKCGEITGYGDGWCRTCDGFTQADPGEKAPFTGMGFDHEVTLDAVPLESDDAYTVTINRAAVNQFVRVHGGGQAEAVTQIRSLLEDLLLGTPGTKASRGEHGGFSLKTRKPPGYALVISSDCSAVLSYNTAHRERTYSQVRAGVESRISEKKIKPKSRGYVYAVEVMRGTATRADVEAELAADADPKVQVEFERQLARMEDKFGPRFGADHG